VVRRQLIGRALRLALAACVVLALLPAIADGSNRRISIGDYQWSDDDIHIDLGEHVNWYWIGPDTMHSVTGDSPNAAGLDSDPGNPQPNHKIGDHFELDFNKPGTYKFRCKLHSTVRGTITVSDKPGNPTAEPDPVPQTKEDLKAPKLSDISLVKKKFRRPGTHMHFSMGERGRVSTDFYRFDREGRRHFAGYAIWNATVGYNSVPFGNRRKHFRPRPGRYIAEISATDHSANTSKTHRLRFRIRQR
jgi:plastocyanin